jgi:ribosomal protein S27E
MENVRPRAETVYFWECPHCREENEIGFLQSDKAVACESCRVESFVESTTEATPERNLDL